MKKTYLLLLFLAIITCIPLQQVYANADLKILIEPLECSLELIDSGPLQTQTLSPETCRELTPNLISGDTNPAPAPTVTSEPINYFSKDESPVPLNSEKLQQDTMTAIAITIISISIIMGLYKLVYPKISSKYKN